MKKIEIYTKSHCSYCRRAIELLDTKKTTFVEYDVTNDPAKEQEMRERSGRMTVPEIFIDESLVGGCDDLYALEQQGILDRMLED